MGERSGSLDTPALMVLRAVPVREAGLCMLDVSKIPKHWNVGPLPPVGASPDGLITMSNGERFVVEVKNSSPFRSTPGSFVIVIESRTIHRPRITCHKFS